MTDWDGAEYAQISGLQRAMASASLESLVLAGTERVLDVGCGDGFVTGEIAKRLPGGSVLGMDPSPRMIAAAQAIDRGLANLEFVAGDVTTMTFGPDFDLVASFNALHWVHDQQDAYRNIAAALRPDGRVLVQFVCEGERPSIEDVAWEVSREPRWASAFADFVRPYEHIDPDSLATLAAGADLQVTALAVRDREWDFGSRAGFAQWCTVGFADWVSRLSEDELAAFVDEVVDGYEAVVGQAGLFRFLQLRAELSRSPAAS